MQTLEGILGEHPLLVGMTPEHVELLAGCARNVRFEPGQFLLREGEAADGFFLVRQGKVAVQLFGPDRGAITIQTLGEGEVLGWSWLIPPYRWHFAAQAVELTRALSLDGKCLRGKCDEDRELGYELLRRFAVVMAERLEATTLQLLDLYAPTEEVKR